MTCSHARKSFNFALSYCLEVIHNQNLKMVTPLQSAKLAGFSQDNEQEFVLLKQAVLTFWEVIVLLVVEIVRCAPGIIGLNCIQVIEMQVSQKFDQE